MIVRLVAAAVVAAGLLLAPAVPAQAVPGLSVHTAVTTASSPSVRSIAVSCPAGKRVIGGGSIVDGADGKAFITAQYPVSTASGDRFEVVAVEVDEGYAGNWWLRAFAICANPVPGLQIISTTRAASSLSSQTNNASCPSGTRLLGAGGRVNSPAGQVALQSMTTNIPVASLASVSAREDANGYTGSWGITTYAICANLVAGFSIASGTSASDSTDAKAATATCPSGRQAHGPLFAIGGGKGGLVLETLKPNVGGGSVTVVAREETAIAEDWSVAAHAICAT